MSIPSQSDLLQALRIDRDGPKPPRARWPWVLLALGVAGAGLAWGLRPEPARVVPTAVVRSAAEAREALLDASGYIVARRAATVSSKVTGRIAEVLIEEGQAVKAGQLLARLDDSNARAQWELARAQRAQAEAQAQEIAVSLANAERDLARTQSLVAQKLLAQAALDNATTAVQQLQARQTLAARSREVADRQLAIAQSALNDLAIVAPFSGVITQQNAQPGEMISPLSGGGSSFTRSGVGTLVDMDSLEVEVDVAESFLGKVQADLPVAVRLNAYPDEVIAGKVLTLVPTADRAKATVKLRVALLARDPRVLPEMGARVSLLPAGSTPQKPQAGFWLPAEALQADGGILRLKDGIGEPIRVTVAERQGREVRVLAAALAAGDVIVTVPATAKAKLRAAP